MGKTIDSYTVHTRAGGQASEPKLKLQRDGQSVARERLKTAAVASVLKPIPIFAIIEP